MPSESVTIAMPLHDALAVAHAALQQCGVSNIRANGDSIVGTTAANILSWGSSVSVTVVSVGNGQSKVTVSAGPRAQLVDWGRGAGEVRQVIAKINELASSQ